MATDLGKLGTIEFREDGKDVEEAVATLTAGKATVPQFSAWSKLRDDWNTSRARAGATTRTLSVKMSDKGYLTFTGIRNGQYGLGAYPREWLAAFTNAAVMVRYIRTHRPELERATAKDGKVFPLDTVEIDRLCKLFGVE